ncbi:MAG: A24 family peptidase [Lachnospiraceae bacterium]|nr:A24 family peptidase [Lachnospiraceae bacterium]
MCTNVVYVLFLSLSAYVFDLQKARVPNTLILIGYTSGFIYAICEKGASGVPEAIISLTWPILLLYVLFRIKALGAGDLKTLSMISLFLDHHQMLTIIFLSLVIGAAAGGARLIRAGMILSHLKNFQIYVQKTLTEKKITYYQTINEDLGKLHFCGCIFAACCAVFAWEGVINNGAFQGIGM